MVDREELVVRVKRDDLQRPDAVIEWSTGIYRAYRGVPVLGTALAYLTGRCVAQGHDVVAEDFGRSHRCLTCQGEGPRFRMGDPAPEGPGEQIDLHDDHPTNCPNCGAPREPVRCSYCLTPSTQWSPRR